MELNANQPNTDVDNAKKSAEFHLFYLFIGLLLLRVSYMIIEL
jgi:hypothetical protein